LIKIEFSLRQLNLFSRCVKNESNLNYKIKEKTLIIENNLKTQLELIIKNIDEYYNRFGVKYNKEPTRLGLELLEIKDKFTSEVKKL